MNRNYVPKLEDIQENYKPKLSDLVPPNAPAQNLEQQAIQQATAAAPSGRFIQKQEAYSNPTIMPGFENLPEQEKLQRIGLSAFDPANVAGERSLPPGAYENPLNRSIMASLLSLSNPEMKAAAPFGRYLVAPVVNALSRIMSGTGANILASYPELMNKKDLKGIFGDALKSNILAELPAAAIRAPGYVAEMAYPERLTRSIRNDIQQGYKSALAEQKEAYNKAIKPHANVKSENKNIEEILNTEDIEPVLSGRAKELVDLTRKSPTVQNLHALQSQLGKDEMLAARSKDYLKTQDLRQYKQNIQDVLENTLNSIDKDAAQNYKLGREITAKKVSPYEATEGINKIAEGRALERSPIQVRQALRTGIEKKKSGRGENIRYSVPEEHPLRMHHDQLHNSIELGKQLRYLVPALGGAIGGYAANPSLSGALTGLSTGAIGAGLGHLGIPGLSQAILNPKLENVFSKIQPLYYGTLRSMFGNQIQNE